MSLFFMEIELGVDESVKRVVVT